MHYRSLPALIADAKKTPRKGPVALILIEDGVEVASTIAHHHKAGFAQIILFCAKDMVLPENLPDALDRVDHDVSAQDALQTILNAIIRARPDQWVYYCYNAEYLYYPFCETRSVGEMLGFMTEERRDTVMSYVIDLYAQDLKAHPSGVDRDTAYFDKSGYYALARHDAEGVPLDRQVDIFGGLRWRFEEHIPKLRQRTDRVSFFRATAGLQMLPDRSFNNPEYNTFSCPWHNNLSAAIGSFRTAKALRRNPGSRDVIQTFHWPQSEKFSWQSQQLLDLGLMEPGQWF
ncbi:MAG: glycosyltransferase family 2 protein [Yoonia sp.]|uniref:glycosyltransferase family 2 protein n=1 Tax=Yoonia sp. TaxID=2212373 RepID=UPI002775CAE9|nr:glycosyltransferase family 2 protein [Yoonia sp.]